MPTATQIEPQKQDTRLHIRVSHEQLDELRSAALSEGLTVSAWVKRVLTLALRQTAT
jgi:predicted HicB family RNase H-like nuclease